VFDAWIVLGPEFDCTNPIPPPLLDVYVYPLFSVPLCPSLLLTTTFTAPAPCAGVVAVMVVLLPTLTPVAAIPPKLTVAPARNPVPVIVTGVPPAVVPDPGVIELTVGAGFPGVVYV
jgi:hypothetical protein